MHRRRSSTRKHTTGFTLVEILVALAVMGIAVGAIYGIFIASNKSYHTQDRVAEAQQGVRVGVDFMVRDIRMAGLDPLTSAGAGIEQATTTRIRFTADIDMNGIIDNPQDEERMTYEYDSANSRLRRCLYEGTAGESWQTLIDKVSVLSLGYLDASGNAIATPVAATNLNSIKTVIISMTCNGTDTQGQTFSRTINTRVICRNQ
ncbi:MAG: prepilin-type N-terminal cleavage/methylation domain-containing protein [Syntrophobacterales bacterium]|nr:prepilin-type N-terminal cleavage/methylation domain-containing protein [Syntrophobacterales bacterium]